MKLMISTSKIKEQDMSAKVTVIAGKATKTKPAMATINVATAQKKTAAKITFKPTKEATLEKPKYEIRLNRMGKGFRMKNAAECIQSLKVFGFDPKDGKPIRDFVAGKLTAAQFKKAMGTKSYTHKEDEKALDTVKMINAAELPTSGKGKITRKMVDAIFEHYQSHPVIRPQDVKRLLTAIGMYNSVGRVKPSALKSIRTLFSARNSNMRNPKIKAMAKKFNDVIAMLEKGDAGNVDASNLKLSVKLQKDGDGDQRAIFGLFDGRTCVRGIEILPSFVKPFYYAVSNGETRGQLKGARLQKEYDAIGINQDMSMLIDEYASEAISASKFARAFRAGGKPTGEGAYVVPDFGSTKLRNYIDGAIKDNSLSARQGAQLSKLLYEVGSGSAKAATFDTIQTTLFKRLNPEAATHQMITTELNKLRKNAGVKEAALAKLSAKVLTGLNKGFVRVTGGKGMDLAFRSGDKKVGIYTSFGEVFSGRKTQAAAIKDLGFSSDFNERHAELIRDFMSGGMSDSAFARQFNAITKGGGTATGRKTGSKIDPVMKTLSNLSDSQVRVKIGGILEMHLADGTFSTRQLFALDKVFAKIENGNGTEADFNRIERAITKNPNSHARLTSQALAALTNYQKAKSKASAKPKDTGTTTAKVDGNVVTDGNLSVTIEDDSKLTAAEANKIVGYFSKLIEAGEVAKAQCTRALKDLAAGTMSDQMKKRWLARIGASSLRPVPRKLVTLLREGQADAKSTKAKPAAIKPTSNAKPNKPPRKVPPKPSRKTKTSRKPKKLPHSILNSIEAAIEENDFDDVLGARVRGDLFEVYVLGNNQTVWSYNDKAKKAIDYTSPTTTGMYTNIDLGALAPIQQVNEIADLLHHLS